jgi:hypothetical protein
MEYNSCRWHPQLISQRHMSMSLDSKHLTAFFLRVTLLSAIAGIGCAERHYYRVYDPYYTDYHVWNNQEIVYYRQWSNETHRHANRDFPEASARGAERILDVAAQSWRQRP